MAGYRTKTQADLQFAENRANVQLTGRLLLNRVFNEVLSEMDAQFQEALIDGDILVQELGREDVKALLLKLAKRELAPSK